MESQDKRLRTMPGVNVTRISYSSNDEKTLIEALLWTSEAAGVNPQGIVQITHGMEEHIGRYLEFANYLAGQGFAVCAQDLIGHGLSVTGPEKLSCIPLDNGKEILIEDAHELRNLVASRFPQQTPYIMFGHSMGSYIIRSYVARRGEGLAAAVLCGAGHQTRLFSWGGNKIAHMIARFKAEDYRSNFLENIGAGAFSKNIKNARTQYDWLCTDENVVDEFMADPLCGVPFSAGAYAALTDLTGEVARFSNAKLIPKDLPVLVVAGALDPVGNNGKGVKKAAELLRRAGVKRVDVKLYEGLRHEILNEPAKKDVYTDIKQWIEGIIA